MILIRTGVTDIGRKSVSKWGFLTLGTGVMDVRFHCSGAVEVAMERLKSWACLHIVMSVYYLLVDYYVYFVYVCMFATTKWWIKMNIMGRGARFAESHTRCLGVLK